MYIYIGYAILAACYLMGGIGTYMAITGRQRSIRIGGAILFLIGLTIRFALTAPAMAKLILG